LATIPNTDYLNPTFGVVNLIKKSLVAISELTETTPTPNGAPATRKLREAQCDIE
jgi:hypothetical protein